MNRATTAVASLALVAGLAACGSTSTTTPTTPTSKAAPSGGPASSTATIGDGTWLVGEDMAAGQWKTSGQVEAGCYWQISKAGTNGNDIIANDNVSGGVARVTVKKGQEFKSDGCGDWIRA